MTEKRSVRVACMAVLLAVLSAGAATQNIYTWDGGAGTTNWFDAANWDLTGAPNTLPGTTQNPSGNVLDLAQIGNVSGTISYTPGTPTNFDILSITKSDSTQLTVNINGNLTTKHSQTGSPNPTPPNYNNVYDAIGGSGNLIFNVNSGTYSIENIAFTFSGSQFNIAPGAAVVAFANNTIQANRDFAINGGSLKVQGALTTYGAWTGLDSSIRGNGISLGNGDVIVDGGQVTANRIFYNQNLTSARTFAVTNNGVVTLRYGGSGFILGGTLNGTYTDKVVMASGTVTNNTTLQVGTANGSGATKDGNATVTIAGGTWNQNGSAYIGDGRVGTLAITGASTVFSSPADVFVGSGRSGTDTAPSGLSPSGTLTLNGGTVMIVNTNAGAIYTVTVAGRSGTGNIYHFFGVAGGTWDHEYTGQRVVFDSLGASGNGLSVGTTYFAYDVNPIAYEPKCTFGLATASGGGGVTGSVNYAISGTSYHTLGARLLIGNLMTFSATNLVIPGTLNLNGGSLTADELVATNGASSVINFSGGTLSVKAAAVNTGSALTVGNGSSAATLSLLGTNAFSFANGLIVNTNAVFAVGGTNAIGAATITGDVTLRTGAILDVDFNAATNDWLQVTGTVNLPAQATLSLRAPAATTRSPIPVLRASGGITGTATGWPHATANGVTYKAVMSGDQLLLQKVPGGTMIGVR